RAIIRVRLPRTWADVSVNGRKVDSMGKTRTYVTPELSAARTFVVTATWQDNGRTTQLQDQVTMNAGQIGAVDFTSGKCAVRTCRSPARRRSSTQQPRR